MQHQQASECIVRSLDDLVEALQHLMPAAQVNRSVKQPQAKWRGCLMCDEVLERREHSDVPAAAFALALNVLQPQSLLHREALARRGGAHRKHS